MPGQHGGCWWRAGDLAVWGQAVGGGDGVRGGAVLQLDGLHLRHGFQPHLQLPGGARQEVRAPLPPPPDPSFLPRDALSPPPVSLPPSLALHRSSPGEQVPPLSTGHCLPKGVHPLGPFSSQGQLFGQGEPTTTATRNDCPTVPILSGHCSCCPAWEEDASLLIKFHREKEAVPVPSQNDCSRTEETEDSC